MAKLDAVMIVLAIAALSMVSMHGADAATYVVGDSTGWRVPASTTTYSDWASSKSFAVGDTLVFNFATGAHDVAEVTQANYGPCTTTSPIRTITTGPANVTLTEAKTYYFICTIGTHCTAGQKVSVAVSSSPTASPTGSPTSSPTGSPTSSPGPSTSTPTTPPPPGNAAASFSAGSRFFLVPLAMVMGYILM